MGKAALIFTIVSTGLIMLLGCLKIKKLKIAKFVWFNLSAQKLGIPVFLFHRVEPTQFENLLKFLSRNDYRSLICEELYSYLKYRNNFGKAVCLTFDDGRLNNWSVVFPLLKKI